MPVGPRGEKRPVSPVSSMAMAMKIATGQMEEQYVDGQPRPEEQVAARKIVETKKRKRKKGKKAPKT